MKFGKGAVCELKSPRNWATLCVLLVMALLLYHDPFLLLWWPQKPAEKTKTFAKTDALPLDMATDSIDDMYDGCLSESASAIDLFGVYEWHFNGNFSIAWASAESRAKRPVHGNLKEEHAIVIYMYTKVKGLQQVFNHAVKTRKHNYTTHGFKFHYFYFYLTDAIQTLRHNQTSCRTTYLRTWKRFDQNVVNTNIRFGAFTWAGSSKQSFGFNGNVSCFEIYSCFGADITDYSATNQIGQVLIPPYEVFKVTDVLTNGPWCSVVYKLESTKIPRADLNCKLHDRQIKAHFGAFLWNTSFGMMSACMELLIIISVVLVKHRQKRFVAGVLAALLVLVIILVILRVSFDQT